MRSPDLAGVCPTSICGDLERATRAAFLDASTNPNGGTTFSPRLLLL